jgi:hypothetical protein
MAALGPHAEASPGRGGAEAIAVRRFRHFGTDFDIQHLAAAPRHGNQEVGSVARQLVRRLRERYRRHPRQPVQPVVAKQHAGRVRLGSMGHAALQPCRSAHFEHVAEIGGKIQRNADGGVFLAVVGKGDAFKQPVLPKQPDAFDMDRALRNVPAADALHRQIGQVGGEEHIVLAERRTEQRCLPVADGQPEFGKHSRVVTEETVAGAADIAVGVGHGKTIALLEGEQPMRLSRCGGVQGRKCYRGIKLALVELGHSLHIPLVSPP